MRTLCDVCETAAALLFCAADEAALCLACDQKVHSCNKLASRHVRVGLAKPVDVPRCDICENAPAFFYCEVDGSSLCLQCDMSVHVGGKRTHGRYLLLRQRVEFPGDKSEQRPDNNNPVASQSLNPDDDERPQDDHPSPIQQPRNQIWQEQKVCESGKEQQNNYHKSVYASGAILEGKAASRNKKIIDLNLQPLPPLPQS